MRYMNFFIFLSLSLSPNIFHRTWVLRLCTGCACIGLVCMSLQATLQLLALPFVKKKPDSNGFSYIGSAFTVTFHSPSQCSAIAHTHTRTQYDPNTCISYTLQTRRVDECLCWKHIIQILTFSVCRLVAFSRPHTHNTHHSHANRFPLYILTLSLPIKMYRNCCVSTPHIWPARVFRLFKLPFSSCLV